MSTDWPSDLVARARVHAALGEPARLAVVERLLLGDASPGEIGRALGLPSNLLAHHVKLLEQAGVVEKSRSEGDHRRTYLRLRTNALGTNALGTNALGTNAPGTAVPGINLLGINLLGGHREASRVVFVCSRNSARSQLAAALWKRRSRFPVASAGTRPAERVHPLAVETARAHGLSLTRARTRHLDDVLRPDDLVVAVCDNAHEELGGDPARRLHWSVPDPAATATREAFDRACLDLADRVDRLVPAMRTPQEP